MRHSRILVTDVVIAMVGLGVFIAGDVIASRSLRLAGFIVIVVGVVAAAILAAFPRNIPWEP
jgi:hypothetical protein